MINWGVEPEKERGLLHYIEQGKSHKELIQSEKGDYMAYYDQISEAIVNNKSLPVSANEAMQVIQIIEAAIQSNKEKRVVNIL